VAYNESLAHRLENLVKGRKGFSQKKMFGGVGFLLNGNMCFGVHKDFLILRLGEDLSAEALQKPHTKVFDITGKPMKGWVLVHEQGTKSAASLKEWIESAIGYVRTLPAKE